MSRTLFFFVLLAAALGAAAAGLLLCQRCGTEYAEGQDRCAHCGGVLPASGGTAAPEAAEIQPEARSAPLLPVREELRAARELLDAGRAGRAWLRARHALGVNEVDPDPAVGRSIRAVLTEAGGAMHHDAIACFACKGSGKKNIPLVGMDGKLLVQSVPSQRCPVCGGGGRIETRVGSGALAEHLVRARRAEDGYYRDVGWSEDYGFWLPPGVGTNLGARATASLLRAAARDCDACLGRGYVGCDECEGRGKHPCTNPDCIMGASLCPTCKGQRRVRETADGRTVTKSCPTCRQTGIAPCETCEGRGYLVCEGCEGRAEIRCKSCSGTGEAPACGKCDGEGLIPCRTCRGAGEDRGAPCKACKGEGSTLCESCRGSGIARRP